MITAMAFAAHVLGNKSYLLSAQRAGGTLLLLLLLPLPLCVLSSHGDVWVVLLYLQRTLCWCICTISERVCCCAAIGMASPSSKALSRTTPSSLGYLAASIHKLFAANIHWVVVGYRGLLELYQTDFDPKWLMWAQRLQVSVIQERERERGWPGSHVLE